MAKKKKYAVEFRFYEIPQGEGALVLCGDSWVRKYGEDGFDLLHFHNLVEIGICRYGCGVMVFDEDRYNYKPGDITIIPPNFPHTTVSDGDVDNFWEYVFLDEKEIIAQTFPENQMFQNEAISSLTKYPIITNVAENPRLGQLIEQIIEERKMQKNYYVRNIRFLLSSMMIEILRADQTLAAKEGDAVKGTNMAQIACAIDYINKHYSEDIKAQDLASVCNMSGTHFRRIFENIINMPPMDYVNLIRIQKACEMMKKTNDSMDVIASKCGFSTASTFNRNFHKFLDTSPYKWKINPENYESKLLNYRIQALKGW